LGLMITTTMLLMAGLPYEAQRMIIDLMTPFIVGCIGLAYMYFAQMNMVYQVMTSLALALFFYLTVIRFLVDLVDRRKPEVRNSEEEVEMEDAAHMHVMRKTQHRDHDYDETHGAPEGIFDQASISDKDSDDDDDENDNGIGDVGRGERSDTDEMAMYHSAFVGDVSSSESDDSDDGGDNKDVPHEHRHGHHDDHYHYKPKSPRPTGVREAGLANFGELLKTAEGHLPGQPSPSSKAAPSPLVSLAVKKAESTFRSRVSSALQAQNVVRHMQKSSGKGSHPAASLDMPGATQELKPAFDKLSIAREQAAPSKAYTSASTLAPAADDSTPGHMKLKALFSKSKTDVSDSSEDSNTESGSESGSSYIEDGSSTGSSSDADSEDEELRAKEAALTEQIITKAMQRRDEERESSSSSSSSSSAPKSENAEAIRKLKQKKELLQRMLSEQHSLDVSSGSDQDNTLGSDDDDTLSMPSTVHHAFGSLNEYPSLSSFDDTT
jgi:hypothetical protein